MMEYAPSSTLLGQLQRGLGRGYRAALEVDPEELHPTLTSCITSDPRWDPQLDDRRGMYASLGLRSELGLEALRSYLAGHDDTAEGTWNAPLTIAVLGDLAFAGSAEAADILAWYVEYGFWWWDALQELMAADASDVLVSLESIVERRSHEARDETNLDFGPRIPEVWRAFVAFEARPEQPNPLPDLRQLSTDAALEATDHVAVPTVVEELSRRTGDRDVQHLLRTAADPSSPSKHRSSSLLALAHQKDERVIPIIEDLLSLEEPPRGVRGHAVRAFETLPASMSLQLARSWIDSPRKAMVTAAIGVLSRHATVEDIPALLGKVNESLRIDEQWNVSTIADALKRHPLEGPFPELDHAYEEMTYSYGRTLVVEAIAATDPSFSTNLALECLWDCESPSRKVAVETVHLDERSIARLEDMAEDDPFEDEEVSEAAETRLNTT